MIQETRGQFNNSAKVSTLVQVGRTVPTYHSILRESIWTHRRGKQCLYIGRETRWWMQLILNRTCNDGKLSHTANIILYTVLIVNNHCTEHLLTIIHNMHVHRTVHMISHKVQSS